MVYNKVNFGGFTPARYCWSTTIPACKHGLKELKVQLLNTPDDNNTQQQAETTDWTNQFCSTGSTKLTHPEQLKLYYYKLQQNGADLMHWAVRFLINLIEQTQGFLMCPKQQSSFSHNCSVMRTTLCSKFKWDFANDIHTGHNTLGWTKYMHWNSCWACLGKQITFLYSAHDTQTPGCFRYNSTRMSLKRQLRVSDYPKNTQTLFLLKLSTTKSEITIQNNNGP